MYKFLILLSFSNFLWGMHQESDAEFVARVQQRVNNGADDRMTMAINEKKIAWIRYDKITQKDVLRYHDATQKPFVVRETILSNTSDSCRAFFITFNTQLTKLIVFYNGDTYDIIDVNKIE